MSTSEKRIMRPANGNILDENQQRIMLALEQLAQQLELIQDRVAKLEDDIKNKNTKFVTNEKLQAELSRQNMNIMAVSDRVLNSENIIESMYNSSRAMV